MWTDEASGMYIKYLSIAEEGTSSRANFFRKDEEVFIWHVQQF